MRGTQWDADSDPVIRRFIPAYAGNASNRSPRFSACAVHPRVCGERGCWGRELSSVRGSSPRMRGTLDWRQYEILRMRFIPAYAGNAKSSRSGTPFRSVHPRVCGERKHRKVGEREKAGSSPRMRGTRRFRIHPEEIVRFIPAYAGNATAAIGERFRRAVHPRVCGERYRCNWGAFPKGGSSPRMRGTRESVQGADEIQRFIPAYAGNAQCMWDSPRINPVHPRVCGERILM